MGREGVDFEEVAAVCRQIREQGHKVGPVRVRDVLGKGSYGTISPYVRRWLEESHQKIMDEGAGLSTSMRDAILREVALVKQSTEQLQHDFIHDLQSQLKDMEQNALSSEEEIAKQKSALEALRQENAFQKEKITKMAEDMAFLEKKLEGEQKATQAANLASARYETQLESMRDQLKNQSTQIEKLAREAESKIATQATLAAKEKEFALLKAEMIDFTGEKADLGQKVAELKKELQLTAESNKDLRIEFKDARDQTQATIAAKEKEFSLLKSEFTNEKMALVQKVAELQKELHLTAENEKGLRHELKDVRDQVKWFEQALLAEAREEIETLKKNNTK